MFYDWKKFINDLTGKVDEERKIVYLDKAWGRDFYDVLRDAVSIMKNNPEYTAISCKQMHLFQLIENITLHQEWHLKMLKKNT